LTGAPLQAPAAGRLSDVGISAYGAYVPKLRVVRSEIAAANSWLNPSLSSLAQGERSTCGHDEDAITLAVDAARDCLGMIGGESIGRVLLSTTSAPFADRVNAGIVASALELDPSAARIDVTGSWRSGLTALITAFDATLGTDRASLCVGADRRRTPVGGSQEMLAGHGAAAVVVSKGGSIARIVGHASISTEFVDHYRAADSAYDYLGEERWVREEGYLKILPDVITRLLKGIGLTERDVGILCVASPLSGIDRAVARAVGINEECLVDPLFEQVGHTGAAHPLLLLTYALDSASPGDRILVCAFGQGGEAILFEATDELPAYRSRKGQSATKWIGRRAICSYHRYLALNDLLAVERGPRAEADRGTSLSALYRERKLLFSLGGGECSKCGTRQIPRSRICVNPGCTAFDTQSPVSFANTMGRVASWSADHLTFTPDPPAYYGMIDFDGGGRLMMDFADVGANEIAVGARARVVFRVKDRDPLRGFTRYFWKATLVDEAAS
jgi:hydroxymethylglutaryl-CoA synthase